MTKNKRGPGRPKGSKNRIKKEQMVALPRVPKSAYGKAIEFLSKLINKADYDKI